MRKNRCGVHRVELDSRHPLHVTCSVQAVQGTHLLSRHSLAGLPAKEHRNTKFTVTDGTLAEDWWFHCLRPTSHECRLSSFSSFSCDSPTTSTCNPLPPLTLYTKTPSLIPGHSYPFLPLLYIVCTKIIKIWLCDFPPVCVNSKTTQRCLLGCCWKVCTKNCPHILLWFLQAQQFTWSAHQTSRIPRDQDSLVDIVTRLRAGRSGVRSPAKKKEFFLPQIVHSGAG